MYNSRYDANQGNIQSHVLLSQRWMPEQDGRSGNNTSCISHSILSLVLTASCETMQGCCNASDLTSLCILSNRSHQGWAIYNITIHSVILISVSTNHDMGLIVLPLLCSAFCFCFLLRTKAQRKKEARGLMHGSDTEFFIIELNCLLRPEKTYFKPGRLSLFLIVAKILTSWPNQICYSFANLTEIQWRVASHSVFNLTTEAGGVVNENV